MPPSPPSVSQPDGSEHAIGAPSGKAAGWSLDAFQIAAIKSVDAGRSVLVSAPTGAGKTVIAEHALQQAMDAGVDAVYTTPIKALSNQKFRDFQDMFGEGTSGSSQVTPRWLRALRCW